VIGVFSSGLILGEPMGFREIAALILVLMALAIAVVKPEGL
jgi:drug/metabolite transporter (DMT)-like permease